MARHILIDTVAKGARMLDNHPLIEIEPWETTCGECNRVHAKGVPHTCDTEPRNLNSAIRKAAAA